MPDGQILYYDYYTQGHNTGQLRSINKDIWWGLSKTQLISELDNNHWDGHTKVAYGNGLTRTTQYDAQGNIQRIQTHNTLSLDYQYDATGNITQIKRKQHTNQYKYDAFNRLKLATIGNTRYQYQYDSVGNRTKKIITQNEKQQAQTLAYSPKGKGNRLIKLNDKAIDYNPQGSPLNQPTKQGQRTYRYNNQQRPITLYINGQIKADYTYNGFGERIKKTVYKTINNQQTSTTTYYLYDGRKLTAEINEQGEVTTQYVYYNNQAVVKLEKNNTYYIHNDHLGTPKAVTNKNQQIVWQATYSPFGEVQITKQDITLSLRFPGQYHDQESNTYYNYFRDYNPQTGRYLTSDPIGLQGGINTYAYVGGNPLNRFDLLGLCPCGLPSSSDFINNYPDYDNYTGSEVWSLIGGSINNRYGESSPNGTQNSCAARVSHALNESGADIPNSPLHQTNRNWGGNNKRYIISARLMNDYLRQTYGLPSQTLINISQLDSLKANLDDGQAAIVSSNGHVSVVTKTYSDPYVSSFLGDVWVLPTGACSCD